MHGEMNSSCLKRTNGILVLKTDLQYHYEGPPIKIVKVHDFQQVTLCLKCSHKTRETDFGFFLSIWQSLVLESVPHSKTSTASCFKVEYPASLCRTMTSKRVELKEFH
ncbi:hypothetical protein GOP47_0010816 [Adiantum capillus-veneris]|uniref:Uncharacterized protein n=1 Tax=Adiantum capillus-veneris TaxID=13818 RepID=A0A9D4UW04_ADICA|nr:hypothetical protein GOP47_0010816 [Adiantum capillus-veneris]